MKRISKCWNVDKIWQRTSHLKRNVYLNFSKGSFVSSERKCGSRCVRLDTQYFTYFLVQGFYQKCTRVHRHTDTVVSLRQYWGNILIEKVSDSSIFCQLKWKCFLQYILHIWGSMHQCTRECLGLKLDTSAVSYFPLTLGHNWAKTRPLLLDILKPSNYSL